MQEKLLNWYKLNHRKLPFRENNDPYRIWVSEVMLQQTKVDTVIPYYNRFIKQFPTVFDLAKASEEEVYKLWAGLGYYSRAKNLLKCAKEIVAEHKGVFPPDYKKALALPGVGPYTAGAVLSIAYNLKHPAVDGNVMRVIARIYNIADDISIPKTKKVFEEKVQSILPEDARHFNQSIMELGALICTPTNPKCKQCPVQALCVANRLKIQDQLPVKTKIIKHKKVHTAIAIIKNQDEILFINNEKGLLSGLWGFPTIEASNQIKAKENLLKYLKKEYSLSINKSIKLGEETHIFTHKTWKMDIYEIDAELNSNFYVREDLDASKTQIMWLKVDDISNYAISTAFKKVISKFLLY